MENNSIVAMGSWHSSPCAASRTWARRVVSECDPKAALQEGWGFRFKVGYGVRYPEPDLSN
jgi:hypothetical protein